MTSLFDLDLGLGDDIELEEVPVLSSVSFTTTGSAYGEVVEEDELDAASWPLAIRCSSLLHRRNTEIMEIGKLWMRTGTRTDP